MPFFVLICLLVVLQTQHVKAQVDIYRPERKRQIQEKAEEYSRQSDSLYQKSMRLARQRGLKIKDSLGRGQVIMLQQINEIGEALYIGNHSNTQAGAMTRTNQVYAGGTVGVSLSGKSDTMSGKLAIWDGGNALATHQEFGGRVKLQESSGSTDIHATHVAGTMVAAGMNSTAKGMAFGADLKVWDYNNDNAEISLNAANLLISNHSYGYQSGWVYDSVKNKWQWWGNDAISANEDYKFGYYDSNAQALDRYAFLAPNYLIVKSAGNSRNSNGPSKAGEYYFLKNSTKDSSNISRAKNDGYDIISTTGTAKNILTVGAIESISTIPEKPSDVSISDFSSWGPTDDGRIKPDIVGVGTNLLSTSNSSNTAYTTLSGTSMSSPQVAGSLFLLQQLYNRLNKNTFMRSATLKGLALHSAMDIGAVGPDYQTGWGLLDMEKAGNILLNGDQSNLIFEGTLANTKTEKRTFTASGKGDLTATIAWTDPEGDIIELNAKALNNRTPKLVNDLDIKITDETGAYLPFILDPEKPDNVATTGDNVRDNIEKIIIKGAVPGKSYDLTISHKGTLKNDKQDYSLIVSGIGGKEYCSIKPAVFQNLINQTSLGTFSNSVSTKQDFTATPIQVELGSSLDMNFSFTSSASKRVKVAVDWNQDGDFEDSNEIILASDAISGSSYTGKFMSSSTVKLNQYFRMRVISELNSSGPATCGSIGTGEAEEYVIQVIQPSNDLGVLAITNPSSSYCATNGTTSLLVKVKNYGSKTQKNQVVNLSYYLDNALQGSLSGSISEILPGKEQLISVTGNVNFIAGKTYTARANTILSTDQNTQNDLITMNQSIENPQAPVGSGAYCAGATTLNLTSSSANALWYANNVLVGSGASVTAPYSSVAYTVSSHDFSGGIKPASKSEFGTGNYYDNFGPAPIFDIKVPIILESARIYVGTSGTITFSVYNKDSGELISSVTKDLIATRTQTNSTRVNSQLTDDKNDPGQIVQLNLFFPKSGSYILTQSCSNGASIFRSNRSLSDTVNAPTNLGYPYTIPNILSMTGALYNNAPITTGYYYFYDMKFKSLGCPSPKASVAITTTKPPTVTTSPVGSQSVCEGTSVLLSASSSDAPNYQWLLNGAVIAGATSNSFDAKKTGNYQLVASNKGLCPVTTPAFKLTVNIPLSPLLSFLDGVLKTSDGTDLQWYVNNDNSPIKGATKTTFSPLEAGQYYVKLKDINGCLATSEKITVSILATEKEDPFGQLTLFPNPAQDILHVGIPKGSSGNIQISLIDLQGRVQNVQNANLSLGENSLQMDISKLPKGVYLLKFTNIPNAPNLKFIKD
ncbi:MAG: Pyrolysin [Bacteroidota bacterium]